MAVFKAGGHEWQILLDAPTIKMVRREGNVDLAGDPKELDRLQDDPTLLVDVLWLLCRKQAEGRGLNDEQFGKLMVGDPIDAATRALVDAISDFSPARKRAMLQAMMGHMEQVRSRAMDGALAKLTDQALMDREVAAIQAKMERDIERGLQDLEKKEPDEPSGPSMPSSVATN